MEEEAKRLEKLGIGSLCEYPEADIQRNFQRAERIYDVVNLAVDAARTDVILNRNMDKRRARGERSEINYASSCRVVIRHRNQQPRNHDLIIVTDKRAIGPPLIESRRDSTSLDRSIAMNRRYYTFSLYCILQSHEDLMTGQTRMELRLRERNFMQCRINCCICLCERERARLV